MASEVPRAHISGGAHSCARAGSAPEGGCLLKCRALGIWLASPCLDPERWRELQREKGKDRDREERQRNGETEEQGDKGGWRETEGTRQSHRERNTGTWPQADGTDRGTDRNSLGLPDSTPGEA